MFYVVTKNYQKWEYRNSHVYGIFPTLERAQEIVAENDGPYLEGMTHGTQFHSFHICEVEPGVSYKMNLPIPWNINSRHEHCILCEYRKNIEDEYERRLGKKNLETIKNFQGNEKLKTREEMMKLAQELKCP